MASTWCLPPASNLVSQLQCILTRNLTFFFLLIDLIQVRKQKSEKLPLIVLSFMWLKSMWLKTLHNAYKNFVYKELGIECPVFQFLGMLSLFLSSSWILKVVLRRRFRISSLKECTRKTLMHNGVDNFYPAGDHGLRSTVRWEVWAEDIVFGQSKCHSVGPICIFYGTQNYVTQTIT